MVEQQNSNTEQMTGGTTMNDPIIIIGAGISGLYAAALLHSQGIECKIIESRDRIGGRVLSESVPNRPDIGKFDLGPTWYWPDFEPVVTKLVENFGLKTFEQYTAGEILFQQSKDAPILRHNLPEGANPRSMRLVGGIGSLVDALAKSLPKGMIELSKTVIEVKLNEIGKVSVHVRSADGSVSSLAAKAVILALPPRLIVQDIKFNPALDASLLTNLRDKSTWMAGQAKVVAVYEKPFWREMGLSGQAISRGGLLQEIHDASPPSEFGALFGFFGVPAKTRQSLGKEKVMALVMDELTQFYGPSAEKPISLHYKDWAFDTNTAVRTDLEPLTVFPDYGQPPNSIEWDHMLRFAGTETSSEQGGHIEGALRSAERAVSEITSRI